MLHDRGAVVGRALGQEIHALAAELYPICRSIAGPGLRRTLEIVDREIGLEITEIPTGTPLFDWTAPQEWTLRDAWIRDPSGRTVLDAAESNLHVVNFSAPVRSRLPLAELRPRLHSLPAQPELIPYRTVYWTEDWGFCLRHATLERLPEGLYEICIDAERRDGAMSIGEHRLPGGPREFILSAHACHPSLANDNCSGIAVLVALARSLRGRTLRHSYRFLFGPGTLGALAWLARNEAGLDRIAGGLVVSCLGDGSGPTYKRSRRGDAPIDRAMALALRDAGPRAQTRDFAPYGYDERQFCSPGFDLPVGLLQRGAFGEFPEYHTSADDLDFIRPEHLAASHDLILRAIDMLEADWTPLNLAPRGEPQLGRRGLYATLGGPRAEAETMALLWTLNLADGRHGLIDMAERSGLAFEAVAAAAARLRGAGLLAEAGEGRGGGA